MDWDKLKIFHAVAEAGSFTNATINLNLSQSAISRQIQSLEQDLKVQLFERHARGLTLTENGEYVFKTAHEVISKLKEVETSLGDQKNISVQSHCEHHMAPIIGKAHVAYIPKDRVVGLSKLARVVEVFSKRLQTQERLTMQIATTLMESLDAKGVAVTIDSTHQCMTMRGIKKEQASTVTNYYLGQFKEDLSFQNRYLRFISITKD